MFKADYDRLQIAGCRSQVASYMLADTFACMFAQLVACRLHEHTCKRSSQHVTCTNVNANVSVNMQPALMYMQMQLPICNLRSATHNLTHKMQNCDILDCSCDIGIAAAFSYKLGAAICGDIAAAISPKSPHIAVAPALRKPVHKRSPRVFS